MKPIEVGNLDIRVKMNETGDADPDAFVKMKPTEQKMKPIEVGNLNIEVKMNEAWVGMKPIEQILLDGFHFEGECPENCVND